MYDLNRIKERCEKLSATVGDNFDIPIVINSRLTRTLGRVQQQGIGNQWHSIKMEFSKVMLATATDASIESVIDHEWAHYYITKITGEAHGHDAEFKRICAMIGCTNNGVATKIERTISDKELYKYIVKCHDCNEDIGFYTRMCLTLKNLDQCHCKRCGGNNLSYIQNW